MNVYVIESGNGHVKIGISRHPEKRLAQLQAATPLKLSLAHVERTNLATAIEEATHAALMSKHLTGEWFETSVPEAVQAIKDALAKTPKTTIWKADRLPYSSDEFRTNLAVLKLTQGQAAKFFKISIRTASVYANGGTIPLPVAKLLRLMIRLDLKPDDVR